MRYRQKGQGRGACSCSGRLVGVLVCLGACWCGGRLMGVLVCLLCALALIRHGRLAPFVHSSLDRRHCEVRASTTIGCGFMGKTEVTVSTRVQPSAAPGCGRIFSRLMAVFVLLLLGSSAALALDPDASSATTRSTTGASTTGLPQVSVLSITQDPTGYIWVGTQNGLAQLTACISKSSTGATKRRR